MLILLILLLLQPQLQTSAEPAIRTVAFWNLENLYDTINDPNTEDDRRTPQGLYAWDGARYRLKLNRLAATIAGIGARRTDSPPHLLGVCEVENREVLMDLINLQFLKAANYGIIHFNSPDERGIDVALLYNKDVFIPVEFKKHRLLLYNKENFRDRTRDQLVVSGYMDQELIHLIINHWPSRSGGTARSEPYRIAAARLARRLTDSLLRQYPDARILVMGDFNDNPMDTSLKTVLRAKEKKQLLLPGDFYNPMYSMFRLGYGSLAYRDQWNLFDQILVSESFLNADPTAFQYWRAGIHNSSKLITVAGRYKGYPWRTYAGGRYTGGYSDHFPVYIYLRKY